MSKVHYRHGARARDGARAAAWVLRAAVLTLTMAGTASAQAQQDGPRPGEVETAPIRCWWRSDTTQVRIGERFTVTLTCAVIETSSITVAASTNQLDPGAVQLTPFDVVAGRRHDDIVAPPWRYFQYEYRVRLLSEGFFGQDVQIPSLPVTYNIQSTAGGGQGRDQTYILPALSVRVASLVPRDASDIRDDAVVAFESIQARRFRATSATVVGVLLLGFGGVVLAAGAIRATARARSRRSSRTRVVAPAAALNAAVRGLGRVKTTVTGDSWTPALARQAAALVRIAAAVATGRPVAQSPAAREALEREGQVAVRQGLLRPRRYLVSASATAPTIARALEAGRVPGASRAAVEALARALETFNAAGYGRGGELDSSALSEALAHSQDAVRQLRRRSLLPAGPWSSWRAQAAPLRPPSISEERL